jgi:hypothetical protein
MMTLPSGFFGDIFRTLVSEVNLTYTAVESTDGLYGSLEMVDGKEVFNGVVGMLVKGEADMSSGLTSTSLRSSACDFTIGVWYEPGR